MGLPELETAWSHRGAEWRERHLLDERKASLLGIRAEVRAFLAGSRSVEDFKKNIDGISKREPHFGFKGFGMMFFNLMATAAQGVGRRDEFAEALKRALPAPADDDECRATMDKFLAFARELGDEAQVAGLTRPGLGYVPYFLSFFWEAESRERWPIYYRSSRDVLLAHGLFAEKGPLPERYLAFSRAIADLRARLGTDTWGVEALLWNLKQTQQTEQPEQPGARTGGPDPIDLYSFVRSRGLVFSSELLGSLLLSLRTKPFVILSGISGTGKTRVAQCLAEYLERHAPDAATEIEVPVSTPRDAYLPLNPSRIARARITLRRDQHIAFEIPDRGSSIKMPVPLPDGGRGELRLNNIGFTDVNRELLILFGSRHVASWLRANAQPDQILHLAFDENGGVSKVELMSPPRATRSTGRRRHALIPVKSDWTDPRGLLGYFNPLTGRYVRTPFLDLILAAQSDPEHPYVAILDEMNLAHVEYYLSDVLSGMESGEPIELGVPGDDEVPEDDDDGGGPPVPRSVVLPKNLLIVGTVNIDETTHAFSPKVLDRANVIEFSDVSLAAFLDADEENGADGFRVRPDTIGPGLLVPDHEDRRQAVDSAREVASITEALAMVHGVLERFDRHFGYRVIRELLAFSGNALTLVDGDAEEIASTAFDLQLLQKVLPKLSGGREIEAPLEHLLHFCLAGTVAKEKDLEGRDIATEAKTALEALQAPTALDAFSPESADGPPSPPVYPRSAKKLLRMLETLRASGFVSYLG